MAATIVDLTLKTIRDLLVEEAKFLRAVSGQIKDVQKELGRMQSFLEDVDRRKYEDTSVLTFFREIKQLCYQIEDAVDAYASEVVVGRRKGAILGTLKRIACAPCECLNVHGVGTEIASINSDIANLIARMESYGVIKMALERQKSDEDDGGKRWSRRTYGHGVEKDFVGMKKDTELVVSQLWSGDSSKDGVVSIWGMGGLGKTTLAEKIYNDSGIRSGFQAFAWVCVSKSCKPRSIFQDLLEQLKSLSKLETDGMGDTVLVQQVHRVLQSQKCLIVLDDVWEVKDWNSLSPALRVADTSSRVLITTRKQKVAEIGFDHRLPVLSEDEAWKLLQKKAFPATDPRGLGFETESMEQIGRNMVRKCGYLPLAIRVLGGILSKRKTSDWEEVNDRIDLYLRRADDSEDGEIKQVLSLSYDDLPYHLKPCFLYLSRFQEDESIRAEELYLLWMAEGIVSPKDQEKDETLMDVAKQYLIELASRSMVQVQVDEITGAEEFQSCRLHDLLRDLCIEKADKEEYCHLVDLRGGKRSSLSLSTANSRLRRLAVYMDVNQDLDGVSLAGESTERLRSLLLNVPKPDYLFQDLVMTLPQGVREFKKFKFLRILSFQYVKFEDKKLLAGIGKLIHLRLLAFWDCHLLELPSSIGDLPYLQTLDLETRSFLIIPDVLWKLKRLKYLNVINAGGIEGKLSLIGLDELEILYGFSSNNCKVSDLSKLKRLRRLKAEIYGNGDLSEFIDSIEGNGRCLDLSTVVICDCEFRSAEGMSLLRELFRCCNVHQFSVPGIVHIGKLPEYEPGFFPNLTELNLQGGEISEDPMGTLEKLPKLRKLILVEKSFVGKEMVCHAEGFAQLRYLELNRLSNLEKWRVDEGAMRCLSFLKLSSCYRLDMIPDGIRFMKTLQTLEIADMNTNFQRRIGGGGEDFDKVGHISSIFIHF